jgi:uncharacterized protein YndB with AHSA1/START domain
MNDRIIKEHQFSHPITKIWDAITLEQEISTWFIPADFKAEKGYKYTFKHEAEDQCTTINGEILTVNPTSELVYTWVVEGTDIITTVSWKLTENENGTHLLLEHTGISNFSGDSAIAMFESFSGGWDNCINGLEKHLSEVNV